LPGEPVHEDDLQDGRIYKAQLTTMTPPFGDFFFIFLPNPFAVIILRI